MTGFGVLCEKRADKGDGGIQLLIHCTAERWSREEEQWAGQERRETQWVSASRSTPSKWAEILNSSITDLLLPARASEEIQIKWPLIPQFFSDEPPQTSNYHPPSHNRLKGNPLGIFRQSETPDLQAEATTSLCLFKNFEAESCSFNSLTDFLESLLHL